MFPIALLQCVLCLIVAAFLGAPVSVNMLMAILVLIPQAIFSIFVGLLLGTLLTETQMQGVGTLYISLGALIGGAWMDLDMIGGIVKTIGYLLPFAHSIDAARAAMAGNYADIPAHMLWSAGYAVVIFIVAILAFRKRMKSEC